MYIRSVPIAIDSQASAAITMSYSIPHHYTELVLPSTDKSYYNHLPFSTPAVDEGHYYTELVLPSTDKSYYNHIPFSTPAVDGGHYYTELVLPSTDKSYYNHLPFSIPAVDEGHYYTELVLSSTDKSYYNHLPFSIPAVDEGQCTEQVLPSTGCYHSQWYNHLPCTTPPVDGGPCVCTNLVPLSTKPLLPSLLLPSAIEHHHSKCLSTPVVAEKRCTSTAEPVLSTELPPSCLTSTEYYPHMQSKGYYHPSISAVDGGQ